MEVCVCIRPFSCQIAEEQHEEKAYAKPGLIS